MDNHRKYIYCIVPIGKEINLQLSGIEEKTQVYTINYQDIAAVVSDTSLTICDPTRRNMAAHNRVLEAVMKDYTILPARFGLISDSDDKLRGLLAKYYDKLKAHVSKLDGRVEAGVKVFWQKDKMLNILKSRSEKLARLQVAISKASAAQPQALLVEAGRVVKSQSEEWQAKYGNEMYLRLMKVAVDGKYNYPIDVSNILNASFLLNRTREGEFDAAIYELDVKYGDWANIRYVKPIPPYDFVNLEMYLQ